jgi:hypothetical protein
MIAGSRGAIAGDRAAPGGEAAGDPEDDPAVGNGADQVLRSGVHTASRDERGVLDAIDAGRDRPPALVPVEIDYSSISGLFSQEIHFGWQAPSQSGIPVAVAAARQADVAVVFANDAQGEGMDRTSLSLSGD